MRLLLFADLHLDTPFAWAGPVLARRRRLALRQALERIRDLVTELRVDALCCAGDLFEQERYTPDTAAFLRTVFADVHPVPVLLAPGNHDWYGPASLYRHVDWTDNVHVFTEPALRPYPLADGLTLWGAAHCAPANTPGFLDDFRVDRGGVHLALFHGSEQGGLALEGEAKRPHAPFRADQIGAAGLHHALVGHFHTPRDAPDHTYPGNPEPLTFGETGERAPVLVTVGPDGSVSRKRQPVAVTQVSDVAVDISGAVTSAEVRDRVAAALATATGVVRATIHGEIGTEVDLDLADLDGVAAHLGEQLVLRIGRVTPAYDLESLAQEPTVRGQFVRDVLAAEDLDEDERRRVIVTGLRALDGRNDLAVL